MSGDEHEKRAGKHAEKQLGGKHAGKTWGKTLDWLGSTHQADDFGFRMGVIPIPIDEDVARVEVAVDEVVVKDHIEHRLRPVLGEARGLWRPDGVQDGHAVDEGLGQHARARELAHRLREGDRWIAFEVLPKNLQVARLRRWWRR